MKKEFVIDGNRIKDKSSLYEEINRQFMQEESWQLAESLDAFDDLLYGGFGAIKEKEEIKIVWLNFDSNKEAFGLDFTRNFYKEKLEHPENFDSKLVQRQLDELERGEGQTYFEIIEEIISSHPNIELIKK
ncbi:barstar family protein [Sphingobacterium daejeonense]|uniref:barstar family protein n=1 Tax=Sphingobacterium daejeonense TaxID=371142 RepID=UPI0021A3ABD1|nr:barstar family protein [Sphingobacterium daejeonense]MCT1531304.1 barstar family protein [Sphingobacterium daejeonense]